MTSALAAKKTQLTAGAHCSAAHHRCTEPAGSLAQMYRRWAAILFFLIESGRAFSSPLQKRPVLLSRGRSCAEAGLASIPKGNASCRTAAELLANSTGTSLTWRKQPRDEPRPRECSIQNAARYVRLHSGSELAAVFSGDVHSKQKCSDRFKCVCLRRGKSAETCLVKPLPWPLNLTTVMNHLPRTQAKTIVDARSGLTCKDFPVPQILEGELTGRALSRGLDTLTDAMSLDEATKDATFVLFLARPRSGHTLIGSLIDAHPNALVANERDIFEFFRVLRKKAASEPSTPKRRADWMRKQLFMRLVDNSVSCGILGRYQTGHLYSVPGAWSGQWRCRIDVIGDKKGAHLVNFFASRDSDLREFEEFVDALQVKALKVVTVLTNDDDGRAQDAAMRLRTEIAWPRPKHGTTLDVLELDHFACDPSGNVRSLCTFLGLRMEEPYLSLAAAAVNTKYCNNTGTRSKNERLQDAKPQQQLQQQTTALRQTEVGSIGTCNTAMRREAVAPLCALTECPGNRSERSTPQKSVFFAHIPKTGGSSFADILPSLLPPAAQLTHRERSPNRNELDAGTFLATMLRAPRSHVLSQFMHCLYFRGKEERKRLREGYFSDQFPGASIVGTRSTGAPTRITLNAELAALGAWLDRALADNRASRSVAELQREPQSPSGSHPPAARKGRMDGAIDQIHFDPFMWGCYSPWNMQSRVLILQTDQKRALQPNWRAVEVCASASSLPSPIAQRGPGPMPDLPDRWLSSGTTL